MNEALLRADLRRKGINPIKIKKKSGRWFGGKKKITPEDICIFSRQLATMMPASVPLAQALGIMGQGHENPRPCTRWC